MKIEVETNTNGGNKSIYGYSVTADNDIILEEDYWNCVYFADGFKCCLAMIDAANGKS